MEKTLNTFSIDVNDILINGRVLCEGDELVVSLPNGYENLFVGYNIHYQYVHPYYEVVITLYNKDGDRYKLYIRKENAFCSRAYKLVNSETDEEFIYPLIAKSTTEIGNGKFAIFDIHSIRKTVTLRDYPFNCKFESKYNDSDKILFCCYYNYRSDNPNESVIMLNSFDIVDGVIVHPNFSRDLKNCYVSKEDYLKLNSSKQIAIEVFDGESTESIMEKVKKELEK